MTDTTEDLPMAGEIMTIGEPSRIRPLTSLQRQQLLADLNPNRVSTRSANGGKGGKQMAYLETWDVRATLIRVFGFGGWSGEVVEAVMLHNDKNSRGNPTVAMMVTYRLTIHQLGAVYTETAVSGQSGSDFGAAAEFAVKTAESDAMKRCAVNLGTAFGLSLYNAGQLTDPVKQIQAPHQNGRALRRQLALEAEEKRELEALDAAQADDADQPAEPDKVVGTDLDEAPADPEAPAEPKQPAPAQAPPRGSGSIAAASPPPLDQDTPAVFDEQLDTPPTDAALADVQQAFGGDPA